MCVTTVGPGRCCPPRPPATVGLLPRAVSRPEVGEEGSVDVGTWDFVIEESSDGGVSGTVVGREGCGRGMYGPTIPRASNEGCAGSYGGRKEKGLRVLWGDKIETGRNGREKESRTGTLRQTFTPKFKETVRREVQTQGRGT